MALVTDRFIEGLGSQRSSPPPSPTAPHRPRTRQRISQPKITIRDQIQAHATDANCRSCHAKLDPLGLAFEHFDAIGRWREVESVRGGTGDLPKVDASGTLADEDPSRIIRHSRSFWWKTREPWLWPSWSSWQPMPFDA